MSRDDVLVDADWVQAHLGDPGVVLVEVDEDTTAYEKGHIPGAVRLDWKGDLQDPVKRDFVDRAGSRPCCRSGASPTTTPSSSTAATTTGSPPTPTGTSSSTGTTTWLLDGGRKKWELESRELVTDPEPHADLPRPGAGHLDPGFPRRRARGDRRQNLVDVRSPDEYSGRLLAPAHLPQEQSQRRPHPDGEERPLVEGCQRRRHIQVRRRPDALYAGAASTSQGHHRVLPHRRAQRAHLVRAARVARLPNVRNYDGSWTE